MSRQLCRSQIINNKQSNRIEPSIIQFFLLQNCAVIYQFENNQLSKMISNNTEFHLPVHKKQRMKMSRDYVSEDNEQNDSNTNEKFIVNHKKQTSQCPQLLSWQNLRTKIPKLNKDSQLPRCLLKNWQNKFTLSSLSQSMQKPESLFKLRSYCKSPDRQFKVHKQEYYDESQCSNGIDQNQQNKQIQLTFLKQNNKQPKQNMPFQYELTNKLMNQTRLKYSQGNTLKDTNSKWKKSQNKIQQNQMRILNRSNNSTIGFSSNYLERKSINLTKNKSNQLLNSTRTNLIYRIDKTHTDKITKADLFPLEKLLIQRKKKINFRNKWFDNKVFQSQQNQ